ncbi:MAG: hypothetical protein ACJ76X_17720 [Solirubrobacteraceae bacterium]
MEGRLGAVGLRRTRMLLVAGATAASFALSAGTAAAENCTTNANGLAHSGGQASVARSTACAPAYGQPAGSGTGRKVG